MKYEALVKVSDLAKRRFGGDHPSDNVNQIVDGVIEMVAEEMIGDVDRRLSWLEKEYRQLVPLCKNYGVIEEE